MLPRSSQTGRSSTIAMPESVYPLQEYSSDLHTPAHKEFPELDNEDHQEEKRKSSELSGNGEKKGEAEDFAYADLMHFNSFEEMFKQFFVAEHKKLMMIQAKIRNRRNLDQNPLQKLAKLSLNHSLALRKHCYQLQMIIYKSPRGRNYDTAL